MKFSALIHRAETHLQDGASFAIFSGSFSSNFAIQVLKTILSNIHECANSDVILHMSVFLLL